MSTQTDTVRYELMVIVAPDIGETAINKRLEAIKKSLTDMGGEIFFEEIWGLRELAYSIRKHDQGFYAVLDVNIEPKHLKELERMLRLETEVLRHLMMKLPGVYQPKTQAQMETELQTLMPEEEKKDDKNRQSRNVRPAYGTRKAETPVEVMPKVEVKEEKPAKAAKKEEAQEEAPKKAPKKKDAEADKKALEDIDAKLDSILSNPDINF